MYHNDMERYQTNQNEYEQNGETPDESGDAEGVDFLIYDDGYIEQEPRWTKRRLMMFLVALIIIGAMVVVLFAPVLQNLIFPDPTYIPPLATPASQL